MLVRFFGFAALKSIRCGGRINNINTRTPVRTSSARVLIEMLHNLYGVRKKRQRRTKDTPTEKEVRRQHHEQRVHTHLHLPCRGNR